MYVVVVLTTIDNFIYLYVCVYVYGADGFLLEQKTTTRHILPYMLNVSHSSSSLYAHHTRQFIAVVDAIQWGEMGP